MEQIITKRDFAEYFPLNIVGRAYTMFDPDNLGGIKLPQMKEIVI